MIVHTRSLPGVCRPGAAGKGIRQHALEIFSFRGEGHEAKEDGEFANEAAGPLGSGWIPAMVDVWEEKVCPTWRVWLDVQCGQLARVG